jgi:outer membrane receptor protein involved in Fe transport
MHCAGCHAAQEKEEFAHPENHGYQAIGDFRLGLHMIPAHDVLLGVEARRLDRGEHKHELSPGGAIVAGYDKIAAYAQDQFAIVPNRLSAVAGVRYDAKTDLFPARTSPRLALVYTPSDRLVLRSGYSTAFRFPNFSELYQSSWFLTLSSSANLFPPFPLVTFVPNEQLKPEEIRTFELGGEYQFSPRVSAKADLYRSKVSEFMVINVPLAPPPAPSGVHFENQMSDATVFGGELELRANFDGITGFANWAHQSESAASSAVDSTGTPFEFPYAPKNKLNLGAYAGPFQGWRGAVEASWRSQYRAPAIWFLIRSGLTDPTTHPLPGYTLLNARLSYDLPMHSRVSRPITLSLFANNLLDKRPEETLVGTDSRIVGREIFGQVEVHF